MRVGQYRTIVADPPWQQEMIGKWAKHSLANALPYPTMTLDAIKALPVASFAAPDAHLWLWTTNAFLDASFDVMKAWGFKYKSQMMWRKVTASGKVRMGTGYWTRTMHEPVLIGVMGKPRKFSAFPSVFDGVAREHSRKPEEFYDLVRKHTLGIRRADLFSRATREGFEGWGAETGKFDEAA